MSEVHIQLRVKIAFDAVPILLVVADFFAFGTNGQQAAEGDEFANVLEDQEHIGFARVVKRAGGDQQQGGLGPILADKFHPGPLAVCFLALGSRGHALSDYTAFAKFGLAAALGKVRVNAMPDLAASLAHDQGIIRRQQLRSRFIVIHNAHVGVHDENGHGDGVQDAPAKRIIFRQ